MTRKPKIRWIECRKRYVDEDSDCINVCSKCLYGDEKFALSESDDNCVQNEIKKLKLPKITI